MIKHYYLDHEDYVQCKMCARICKSFPKYLQHLECSHMPNHKHDAACFEDETKIYRRMHVRSLKFQNDEEISIEYSLYVKYFEEIKNEYKKMIQEHKYLKVMTIVHGLFQKLDHEGNVLSSCNLVIPSGPMKEFSNFEMETSVIYGLSKLLGHEALSLNAIIANRATGEFSKDPRATVERLILHALNRIVNI